MTSQLITGLYMLDWFERWLFNAFAVVCVVSAYYALDGAFVCVRLCVRARSCLPHTQTQTHTHTRTCIAAVIVVCAVSAAFVALRECVFMCSGSLRILTAVNSS